MLETRLPTVDRVPELEPVAMAWIAAKQAEGDGCLTYYAAVCDDRNIPAGSIELRGYGALTLFASQMLDLGYVPHRRRIDDDVLSYELVFEKKSPKPVVKRTR